MQKAMSAVNRFFKRELGTEVSMGISIHTGEVVVGNIGFDKKMDYTVIGDAVNTVFRLQELAKFNENGVIISETTLRAARSRLNAAEMRPPSDFADKAGGIKVFELLDQKTEKRILPLPVRSNR